MHIDVRNDEDLRRAAPVDFHPERKSVTCDSSGIDETVLQRCNIVKKKKKKKKLWRGKKKKKLFFFFF